MEPMNVNKGYEISLKRVLDLPSLPDVVNSIIEIVGDDATPASEIAKLISYDPGLTSKCLRMVNSAAYGFQRQISSVQHAIMILGFNTVRGVVLSASIYKMFSDKKGQKGIDPIQFWRHSFGTAIASRVLANKFRIRYAEDAFSAGMLHDIGKMILDYYFAMEYQDVLTTARSNRIPFSGRLFVALEHKILKTDHTHLGYQIAQRWKLPVTFNEVIRWHHHPERATDAPELVYVVALANAFSHILQHNHGVFSDAYLTPALREYFQYDPEDPEPFIALFKEVAAEMESLDDLLISLKH